MSSASNKVPLVLEFKLPIEGVAREELPTYGLFCPYDRLPEPLRLLSTPREAEEGAQFSFVGQIGYPVTDYALALLNECAVSYTARMAKFEHPVYRVREYQWPGPFMCEGPEIGHENRMPSLKYIKLLVRAKLAEASGIKYWVKNAVIEMFRDTYHWRGEKGEFLWGVICLDDRGKQVYAGPISSAPFPVEEMLRLLPWTQKMELPLYDLYSNLAVWRLGELSKLVTALTPTGHLITRTAPAVVLADEMVAFQEGARCLIADKDDEWIGFICNFVDTFFLLDGILYRMWGSYVD